VDRHDFSVAYFFFLFIVLAEFIKVKLVSVSIHRFTKGPFLAFQLVALLNKVSDKSEMI